MFSIKSSKFSNCSECELLDSPSCILETNCDNNLNNVDILICAENPGKQEIKKGIPLIGPSGKVFRDYFDLYLKKFNYLITNCVLCATIDKEGKTINPTDEVINRCKYNLFEMIKICNPKLILSLGTSPMKAFDIAAGGITSIRGKLFSWKDWNVLVTYHPSYVKRNMGKKESIVSLNFEDDFKLAKEFLLGNEGNSTNKNNKKVIGTGIFHYKIPKKFYNEKYRLIDIQQLNEKHKILYIFRDSNNKKIYHQESMKYVCYNLKNKEIDNSMILKYDNLEQIEVNSLFERNELNPEFTYEGDLKLSDKHSIDYYLKNKKESKIIDMNIMFLDIELDLQGIKSFPSPDKAERPINLITICYHYNIKTFVLKNKKHENINLEFLKESIDLARFNFEIIDFNKESELLNSFISDIHKIDPDIFSGWNVINFDLQYIINRLEKICPDLQLSKFGTSYVDEKYSNASIPGIVALDQLKLYKEFCGTKRENYKLGTISQIELGNTKVFLDDSMDNIYQNDLNTFIKYNIKDVTLLVDLEEKLNHISFLNELRYICKATFKSSSSTFSRLDCLVVSKLKEKGLSSKNKVSDRARSFPGAFVREPQKGLHSYIVDLDFTSLYPSLIITYNIGPNTFFCKLKDYQQGYDFIHNFDKLPKNIEVIFDPLHKKQEEIIDKNKFKKLVQNSNLIYTINGCFYLNHKKEESVFSKILSELMKSRKIMKNKMFEAIENKEPSQLFNSRQLALKILANALYGVLGTPIFRFFNVDMATSVTLSGQEAIKTSIIEANQFLSKVRTSNEKECNLSKEEMFGELNQETPYIVTGDTDSLFLTYEEFFKSSDKESDCIKKVQEVTNNVQNYLNDKVIINMIKNHNVSIDQNVLSLKNELLIKKGLYISKKHYANYVLLQEGKKINEIKTMGIEIKRSDYSTFTKQSLSELLELILKKNATISRILNFVKNKEKELKIKLNERSRDCFKPASFVKSLKSYKVIPEAVRGMISWNKLEYEAFFPGSKGYLCKIFGLDFDKAPKNVVNNYQKYFTNNKDKLDVIVFPDEIEKLPDYYIIDKKKMVKFHWTDRHNLLLEDVVKKVSKDIFTI